MADPQFGSDVAPILPQSERYAQFKKQQAQVMQQHEVYAAQLEKQQTTLDARKGDVDIAGKLMKVLDSRLPKPARQFLAKELATHVGADPKSDQAKGVSAMLTSLDPGQLQGMRQGLAAQLDQTQPGEISKMAEGILTGKIPMDSFIDKVAPAMYGGAESGGGSDMSGGGGSDQLSGGAGTDQLTDSGPAPAEQPITSEQNIGEVGPMSQTAPAPFQSGAAGEVSSFEGQRTIPPQEQPASPNIVGALGLDSRTMYRNKDLIQGGIKIPFDAKDQDKLAEEVNTRVTGVSSTMSEATKMVDIFENHPETLGTVGAGVSTVQALIQQAKGLLNVINPAVKDESDPYSAEVQSLANQAGKQLGKIHSIDVTANNAAQLQSMALGLAYKMAIANDIPGNRLTNVIIEQNLRQIGQSSSPQQFKAVLANTLDSTTREFNESIRRKTGINGTDILARQMSQPDLDAMANRVETDTNALAKDPSGQYLIPEAMRRSLLDEALKRKSGQSSAPQITPSSPTLEEERKTLGGAEMQKKQRELAKQDQTMELEQQREGRAARTEERANTREDRMAEAQIRAGKMQEEQFAFSKAEHERDNAFQREQFDYKKTQDRKAEDKARTDKIAAAFQHFGAAISARGGGGGGLSVPSLGGGQDVSAFRMTPAPQRTPPRPGGR